jgi:hypothetical protein
MMITLHELLYVLVLFILFDKFINNSRDNHKAECEKHYNIRIATYEKDYKDKINECEKNCETKINECEKEYETRITNINTKINISRANEKENNNTRLTIAIAKEKINFSESAFRDILCAHNKFSQERKELNEKIYNLENEINKLENDVNTLEYEKSTLIEERENYFWVYGELKWTRKQELWWIWKCDQMLLDKEKSDRKTGQKTGILVEKVKTLTKELNDMKSLLESERHRMPIIYHDSTAESDHNNDNGDDYHYDDNSSETEYGSNHGSNNSTDRNSNHSNLSINGGVYSILVIT